MSSLCAALFFLPCLLLCLTGILTGQLKSALDSWEGTYRYKFANGLMNGKKYQSENRLDLLKLSAKTAYFNTHLEWANGHTCDLFGVADLDPAGALVYRTASIEGQTCIFKIKASPSGIVFDDEQGACRLVSCGNRGGYEGVEFKFKNRGKLNAEEIRKSDDFTAAIEEYKHRRPGK
jgi:hypothetical protein